MVKVYLHVTDVFTIACGEMLFVYCKYSSPFTRNTLLLDILILCAKL